MSCIGVQGTELLLQRVPAAERRREWPTKTELAVCKILGITHTQLSTRATLVPPLPDKNDPHNLPRLRQTTGPRRAAMCEMPCEVLNFGIELKKFKKYTEAQRIMRETIVDARRTLGNDHMMTLDLRGVLADALAGTGDLEQAITMGEDIVKRCQRLLGDAHPQTQRRQSCLEAYRAGLAAREAGRKVVIVPL